MKINEKIIAEFEQYLKKEEKSRNTIEKYIRDIKTFSMWLGGKELEKQEVLEYKNVLYKEYAVSSVNSVLSSLNTFFVFLNRYELKVKTLKTQKRIFADNEKELTYSEYKKLLLVAKKQKNKRMYYLMQTICATGIRVSEHKYITVEAVKNGRAVVNLKGKQRIIILPKQLCTILIRYIKDNKIKHGSIFITSGGKPMDRTNIWNGMKKLCKIAGVKKDKVFPHNLRHLFARTYYKSEKDIVRLANILGHSNVNTTMIYTMETWENCRKQLQKLNLLLC